MPVISMKALKDLYPVLIRDIPIEHVIRGTQLLDQGAYFRYFKGYRIQKVNRTRILELLEKEVFERGSEKLAELFVALWNRANDDLYHEMLVHVKKINEDVEAIKSIDDETAGKICMTMQDAYDKDRIFICVVLNQVKFSAAFVKSFFGRDLPERPVEEEAAAEPEKTE